MELYLMQHGLAVPESEDPERPLSAAGTQQIESGAKAMARMGVRIDVFAASCDGRTGNLFLSPVTCRRSRIRQVFCYVTRKRFRLISRSVGSAVSRPKDLSGV